MAKKLSRSKLIKKLDTIFSKYIRQRDAKKEIATCFTCGKKAHWKKLQNGHFQSRRFEQFTFGLNLDSKFGAGTAQRLHTKARVITKLSSPDIEELILMYEDLVEEF